jgi:phytoene dehydrogenase-like protein
MEGACALPLVLSMAWMINRDAGHAIGGSQAIIRPIVDNLRNLGGRLRLGAKVEKILVERDSAIGVQLVGGEVIAADWVVSAADGHATIYDLLGGRYVNKTIQDIYNTLTPFPSYVQVSLGVARDLSEQAGFVRRVLDSPLRLDPKTEHSEVSFRFFHFDPTFAPAGKTPVTSFVPTRNAEFWAGLERREPARYQEEKRRLGEAVIVLEQAIREYGNRLKWWMCPRRRPSFASPATGKGAWRDGSRRRQPVSGRCPPPCQACGGS